MPCRRLIVLFLAAILLATSSPAPAATLGRGFTYQGQLNQGGAPMEGTVTLRFSLWDAAGSGSPPTGGAMVGSATIATGVPVTGGVFSVELNGNDEFGPQAFNGEARWLQIEVCTDAGCSSTTVLGPRQAMTGAPYALGPWQLASTGLNYMGGNVGIGTTSPAHTLHVKATQPAIILEDSAIPSQQAGYVSFWNSNPTETGWMGYGSSGSPDMTMANARANGDIVLWATGEKLRVKSGGNVGIGTSAPASKLEVRGDIRLGSFGEYFAPSSSENLRVIRGKVTSTGFQALGTGFTCSRTGTGLYQINFSPGFPAVGGSPDITVSTESSSQLFVAMVTLASPSVATIRIVNGSNTASDATFHFIAVGPR